MREWHDLNHPDDVYVAMIGHNGIGVLGVKALARAIERSKNLTDINLCESLAIPMIEWSSCRMYREY